MFLIVYSGQRYKTNIIKTNLITIIFGWERELEGQGEERRENWEGRQGQLRSKPTRHCLVEQGPLGTDRGQVGTGGKAGWERGQGQLESRPTRHCLVEQGPLGTDREPLGTGEDRLGTETGAGGNEGRNRWRRPAPTISYPLKAHDKRGA